MNIRIISALIRCLLFGTLAFGQGYDLAKQKTDKLLTELAKVANIPGLSVAVSIDGEIAYSNSFGLSDIEKKTAVNDSTEYRIGSVTKLFTATATVKLIQDGVIATTTPVSTLIKDLPKAYQNITITQLASHTAGVRHYTREEIFSSNTTEYSDLEDGLNKFISDSLLFRPGEKYSYSSYGYVLLGAALENACNRRFNDVINESVVFPAGMTHTFPEMAASSYPNKSQFYYPSDSGGFTMAEGNNYSYKWPAGGYLSTAKDLAGFGSALLNGQIVKAETLPLLFTSQLTTDGKDTNCGFGFRIGTDSKGRKVVHHGGTSEGARAFFLIYPEQKLSIALLANVFRAPLLEGEAETIAGYFLGDYAFEKNLVNGNLKFTTTNAGKQVTGEIRVEDGILTGLAGGQIPIVDIVEQSNQIRVIAVSTSGIVNLWLTRKGDSYQGKWGYDKGTTDLIFGEP